MSRTRERDARDLLTHLPESMAGKDAITAAMLARRFKEEPAAHRYFAQAGAALDSHFRADPQDYLAVPEQPWLDGYCVDKGLIRQFVAMPLGAGYSVEEQLTGAAEHGGPAACRSSPSR